MKSFLIDLRVGWFVAVRNLLRGSKMITAVTVFILMLTFLNITAVGGVLKGVVYSIGLEGKQLYLGDVVISPESDETFMKNTGDIISYLRTDPRVKSFSPRLSRPSSFEANYQTVSGDTKPDKASVTLTGIYPDIESKTTAVDTKIIAGRYLLPEDRDAILASAYYTEGYLPDNPYSGTDGMNLGAVKIGQKIRMVTGNGEYREMTLVGVFYAKGFGAAESFYTTYPTMQQILEHTDQEASMLAITTVSNATAKSLSDDLKARFGDDNKVEFSDDAFGVVTKDITKAFAMIGDLLGAIGGFVGLVTIFIIIFVNASNRRKFLGILKAQGVSIRSLIMAYIIQAFVYTLAGVTIGSIILFWFIDPAIQQNPIPLPMADARLDLRGSFVPVRALMLLGLSIIAGWIPARMILNQKTLDAILGR